MPLFDSDSLSLVKTTMHSGAWIPIQIISPMCDDLKTQHLWFNRTEALLSSAWQCLAGFDFEARFARSRQQNNVKQQLVPPMQHVPATQMENNGEFNDSPDVVDFTAGEGERSTIQAIGNTSRGG